VEISSSFFISGVALARVFLYKTTGKVTGKAPEPARLKGKVRGNESPLKMIPFR
jgi:hypothetical protein